MKEQKKWGKKRKETKRKEYIKKNYKKKKNGFYGNLMDSHGKDRKEAI